jgi:hypothetical protein
MNNQDRVEAIEKLVDTSSLLDIVAALELMCHEKADHIQASYQDSVLATHWRACAKALYKANVMIATHDL